MALSVVQRGMLRLILEPPLHPGGLPCTVNGNALNQFKDLCTFANISIIMLDEPVHGYYLNAKAPWGSSDIPLDWFCDNHQARFKK